jgi:NhaP-type Na+/H+ or K+/H+ antiporter
MVAVLYAAVGGLALALGLFSRRVRRWPVSGPMLALLLGVSLGPHGLGAVVVPEAEQAALLAAAAELLLGVALMGVALRYPFATVCSVARPVTLLVTVAMVAMCAVLAAVAGPLLGIPVADAVLLGAVLAPTDPVLASGIVSGEPAERYLPERLRAVLSIESGANDGLALPLVEIGVALVLVGAAGPGIADGLAAVAVGAVVGVALGTAIGALLRWVERRHDIEHTAFLVLSLALAICALGTADLLGGATLVAAFAAGLAYGRLVTSEDRRQEDAVDEAANFYLILPLFAVLGAVLPFDGWLDLGWRLPLLFGAVVAVRRLPIVVALARPLRLPVVDAAFLGFYGPVGVAALAYLAHAAERGSVSDTVWAAATFTIAASTVTYGLTASAGVRLYARVRRRSAANSQPR